MHAEIGLAEHTAFDNRCRRLRPSLQPSFFGLAVHGAFVAPTADDNFTCLSVSVCLEKGSKRVRMNSPEGLCHAQNTLEACQKKSVVRACLWWSVWISHGDLRPPKNCAMDESWISAYGGLAQRLVCVVKPGVRNCDYSESHETEPSESSTVASECRTLPLDI